MSLDISLYYDVVDCDEKHNVYSANITHNLNTMAEAAGIYKALWRPEELSEVSYAGDLVPLLEAGLEKLESNPVIFKEYNPANGWGSYELLVEFVKGVLNACRDYPKSKLGISR